jgi:Effector-associated domain 11
MAASNRDRTDQAFPYHLHPVVEHIADIQSQSRLARTLADLYKLVFLLERSMYTESPLYGEFSEIRTLITSDSSDKSQPDLKVRLDKLVNSLKPEDFKSHHLLETVLFPKTSGKDAVKELLAKGELAAALEALKNLGSKTDEKTLILLTGQFNKLEKDQRMGLLSTEDYNLQRNRITASLLALLDELG